jgi:putative ubiquitin-RnfH superfamily antitoxin RatB of RatAB toxin-antitoxin module
MRETYVEIDEYALADLELLADSGVPLHIASKRMGYVKPDTLNRNLHRRGKVELYRKLLKNSHKIGYTRTGATLTTHISHY